MVSGCVHGPAPWVSLLVVVIVAGRGTAQILSLGPELGVLGRLSYGDSWFDVCSWALLLAASICLHFVQFSERCNIFWLLEKVLLTLLFQF